MIDFSVNFNTYFDFQFCKEFILHVYTFQSFKILEYILRFMLLEKYNDQNCEYYTSVVCRTYIFFLYFFLFTLISDWYKKTSTH